MLYAVDLAQGLSHPSIFFLLLHIKCLTLPMILHLFFFFRFIEHRRGGVLLLPSSWHMTGEEED